jgi:hypothetical protein
MKVFYCWITAMFAAYQDSIVAALARKGYMVGPACKDGQIISVASEQSSSVIMAFALYRTDGSGNHEQAYSDVITILIDINAKYYSVVISPGSLEAIWTGSNVKGTASPPQLPPIPVPDKNMN